MCVCVVVVFLAGGVGDSKICIFAMVYIFGPLRDAQRFVGRRPDQLVPLGWRASRMDAQGVKPDLWTPRWMLVWTRLDMCR